MLEERVRMEPEEFEFHLTVDEYQLILTALVDKPFREVNNIIQKMVAEFTIQQNPPEGLEKEKPAE